MEASSVPRAAPAGVARQGSPRLLRVASDAHLVGLIRQGRSVAFEAAYDRHHRAILSFCRHMLGSPEEAEDALQQTFLSAYNDLMASDKPIHLRAWLFTIARNRCYSIMRARREQPVGELDDTATEGLAAQVQRRQELRDLVLDLQRLPEDQRAALVLAEMDALSHEQIASVLGVPREKVKALVFQARESLVASRAARETDCSEIREQLANLTGGALRRGNLRRHLRECTGCREFRKQIDRQRRQLRVILPVAPTLALKDTVLAATVGGGGAGAVVVGGAGAGAAAGGSGGAVATSLLKGGLVKGIVGATVAGVGTAGTLVAVQDIQSGVASRAPTMHRLVQKAPFTVAPPPGASKSAAVAGTAGAAGAAATSGSGSASSQSRSSSTASYAASLVSTTAGTTGGGAKPAGLPAAGTRIAVLNPFSAHGFGVTTRNPLSVPHLGSAPAVPLPPAAPSRHHHHGEHGAQSAGNDPYLGPSAFGGGSQGASGRGRGTGGGSQASSSSSPIPSTTTYPTGSSSSGSSSSYPNTSVGSDPTSGSSSSGAAGQHRGGGTASGADSGSSGASTPSDGNGNGHAYGHTRTPSGSTSSAPHSTTSTPTTTTPTPSAPTSSSPPTTTTSSGPSVSSNPGNGWGAGGNSGSDTGSDPSSSQGDNGSDHGGGSDTGSHGR